MKLLVSLRRNLSAIAITSLATLLLAVLIRRTLVRRPKSNQPNKNTLYLKLVLAVDLVLSSLELRVS